MGNSLGAQLLKTGLISKKQVNKANQERYKKKKKQNSKEQVVSESKLLAQKALAAEKEQSRQLNLKRQQQAKQREVEAQISQWITASMLKNEDGTQPYNFADGKKLKKIYVTKAVCDQLSIGQLAIVKHRKGYEVVPAEVARKVAKRDAAIVLVLNESQREEAQDDPYAEFPIPDDLDW